ncbi:hypothetical protein E7T06_07370 [Deinococcus sp. Arct2-2]|uniref:hypothetical protein n=1 Tax=Deinococcus sp. Arct2-2 TaxID=2568653 RepID=UPI0010A36048|nr:hypothetical protein [Deinococcus sp. Arct2-2]THF70517.1 hypothetical protein E7T06_07370 [Deinococcus sp. Arct2-2]
MDLDKITQYLPALASVIAVVVSYIVYESSKIKQRIDSGKLNIDLVDQLEINLAGGNMRKVEYAFLSLTGTMANGKYVDKIWSSGASIHQMAYLAKSCNVYLKVSGGVVELKIKRIRLQMIIRLAWLFLSALIICSFFLLSVAELDQSNPNLYIFFLIVFIYACFMWSFMSTMVSIDRISDVMTLMGASSVPWVNSLIASRKLSTI